MTAQTPTETPAAIAQLLQKFAAGDPGLMAHIAEDIDFRIDHYADDLDVNWQAGKGLAAMGPILARLGTEVFPQGTEALEIEAQPLGDGWHLTRFHQRFFYGLQAQTVTSLTYILSHEVAGKVDYFRETVTGTQAI